MSDLFPGIPTEIQWIPSFGSIVSSEEDSSQIGRCPNVLRKISFIDDKLTMSYHNSTIWVSIWIIQSEVNSWRWATQFQGISTKKIFLTTETSPFLKLSQREMDMVRTNVSPPNQSTTVPVNSMHWGKMCSENCPFHFFTFFSQWVSQFPLRLHTSNLVE